ncbi:MAG: ATP-dependent RNA helicase HrpA [Kofleriaceae bacterium]|nr:ATP-dependent RNA helicase HrpA [Kofleriaceae bacterium]
MEAPAVLRPGLRLSERVRFPEELPISAHVVELANAIDEHQVVIVAGETGSGKTTQLPKLCFAMGRGANARIGCTQPRRIAASSVASRVAQELDSQLGEIVGFQVRFVDKIKATSAIKFMTDGILLAEIQSDPLLRAYDTLIIDEAHERSLNIDFLLGFLKRLLPRRRDLRVIISSATLEIERFAKFFDGAPVIQVSGRTFPVDVLYRPAREDEADLAELVGNAVNEITELDPRGDVLVFLPGEREIREAMGELEQRALPHTVLLPLYSRLSAAEQQRVFQRSAQRRVVLATNVAETSLTIPGIVYVVDPGLARINRYDVRTGVSQLLVEDISRASADQRKGRCGRVQSGVCFRLYEEKDFLSRPSFTDPEIRRVGLAGVILRMKMLRLGDIREFPFLDPPPQRAIGEGYRVLEELGAIDEEGELTNLGHQLGRLPLDPRLGRMILGGADENALREVVVLASVLGLQDPRDRPQAVQQQADEAHRKWKDEGSDFAALLKIWAFWKDARKRLSRRQLQKLCRDNFLSYHRMREWDEIHEQIVHILKDLNFKPNPQPASGDQIHRALLPGLLSKIGMWNPEARNYVGARQIRFVIHPSSGLAKKPPQWVMAAELVETSQLFARTVAKLDPVWIEKVAGPLCRRSHSDPHWEQKAAQVMAREQVTLFGLPIVKNRSVPYVRFDPAMCRELFITHALVRHEYTTKGAFMAHNQRLADEAHRLRDKARRSDMFADEYEVFAFFDKRLPPTVHSGKTFEVWRAEAEARDPKILHLSLADLLLDEAHDLTPARFPDELVVAGVALPLRYRFEPSEDDDGITVTVPLAVLPQLDPEVMASTIPGWMHAKILALLESLPKALRKTLAPLDLRAAEIASQLRAFQEPLLAGIERAIFEDAGERVGRDMWDLRSVPRHLHFTFEVIDPRDKVLGTSRDLGELQRSLGGRARELWAATPRASYERTGLRAWDFDALPASVTIDVGGRRMLAYPALVDTENAVDLRLLESQAAADAATRDGIRRLVLFQLGTSLTKLSAQLPGALAKDAQRAIVLRAIDEAFGLVGEPPRDKATFAARMTAGRAALPELVAQLGRLALDHSIELGRIQAALKPLVGKPGIARAVVEDVQNQLRFLAPADLWRSTPLPRLHHILRYLRALTIRLQRQANDPQKDQTKAQSVVPLWQSFIAKHEELRAKGRTPRELDDFRWLLEELRVQVFAPELKTAIAVSLPRVQELWASLAR